MDATEIKAIVRRRRRKKDRRGVALIMVLAALTMLTVFLTELQEDTSSELSAAIAERDQLKAEYYARSAVNLTRMLIATEPKIRAAVNPMFLLLTGGKGGAPQIPVWQFTDMVLGVFNDPSYAGSAFGGIGLDPSTAKNLGLTGGGHFETPIVVDEDSKLDLNLAAHGTTIDDDRVGAQLMGLISGQQYNTMFEERDPDNQFSDRQAICSALVDWADPDENAYPCDLKTQTAVNSGSEDNIYQTIGLPYRRKNAAFDSLDEVRMVRGMGDSFWSTFVDPEPTDPTKRVLTIWGQGKVNVNNANAQTLLAILCAPNVLDEKVTTLCTDPLEAAAFLSGVSLFKGFAMGLPLFTSPTDFVNKLSAGGNGGAQKGGGGKSSSSSSGGSTAGAAAAGGAPDVGSLLDMLGVKPLTFKAPGDFKKSITTDSKVFSIYVDGVVPGYRRKTIVRIHAVVDFRGAAQIGQAQATIAGGQPQQSAQGNQPSQPGSTRPSNLPASQSPSGSNGAPPPPGPGGTVVYWRVE